MCCLCAIRTWYQELAGPEQGSGNGCNERGPSVHERPDVGGASVLRTITKMTSRDEFGEGGDEGWKGQVVRRMATKAASRVVMKGGWVGQVAWRGLPTRRKGTDGRSRQ